MKFNKKMKFLGSFQKVSKKGNSYLLVTLFDDGDTVQCITEVPFDKIEFGRTVDVQFEFDSRYKNLKVLSII